MSASAPGKDDASPGRLSALPSRPVGSLLKPSNGAGNTTRSSGPRIPGQGEALVWADSSLTLLASREDLFEALKILGPREPADKQFRWLLAP
jgi:hypothetical protein